MEINNLPIKSLYSFISELSRKYPNYPAIIDYDDNGLILQKISYRLLKKRIGVYAAFLLREGLTSGDSLALALRNSSELLLISWAAWNIGIITVPLDMKKDTLSEHIYKINLSKAKVLVTKDLELKDSERQLISEKIKVVDLEHLVLNSDIKDKTWKEGLEHKALVLFTSGTTAHPKGVELTVKNLIINADGIKDWLKIKSTDIFMVNLPLHHINSTTFCLSTLLAGGSIAIFSNYSNSRFWERMAISEATFTSIVPSICFDQLSRQKEFKMFRDKLKLSRIQIGSAPVVVSDLKAFMNLYKIPLYQGYGQTETALRVTGVPIDLDKNLYEELIKENSIGRAMKWAKVEIMDKKGDVLKEKEDGEIAVKGKAIMEGYIGTKEGFKNGYFLTGDVGFYKIINRERYFFLKGRKKEIIIKGGINISPVAVEDKLKKISDDIAETYIIGVEDRRFGEEIGAVICWNKGVDKEKAMSNLKYRLINGLKHLSSYEMPQYLVSFDTNNLPMTSTGKVQRSVLKNKINKEDFEKFNLIYKNTSYRFFYLLPNSSYFTQSFDLYNYCWDPLKLNFDEFKRQAEGGIAIVALDNNNQVQGLILLIRTSISENELSSISYSRLTLTDDNSVSSSSGESFVCVAICSSNYKPQEIPEIETQPSIKDVEEYLFSGKDGVYNFHIKAKGGLNKGAELISVLPNARPEDKSSLGFNMLMKYPGVDEKVKINVNENISIQLIEVVLYLAGQLGVKSVYAFSRPAGLARYINKQV